MKSYPRTDADAYYFTPTRSYPERVLLLAMLDRAICDLRPMSAPLDRKSALSWFEAGPLRSPDVRFTFRQVAEYLDLSASQLKYIETKVKAARKEEDLRVSEALEKNLNPCMYKRVGANSCVKKKSLKLAGNSTKVLDVYHIKGLFEEVRA